MAIANLTDDSREIITGNDNIVITKVIDTIRGGRTLDVSGFDPKVIKGGHVIIQDDNTKEYKPMPVVIKGGIATFGSLVPGSGYTTDGTYDNVALTGGNGSDAKATVVISGGKASSVTITDPGKDYQIGDDLSASAADIGGDGSGFKITVTETDNENSTYGSLPGSHTYAGFSIGTILTKRPLASILVRGVVNPGAAPYDMTSILSAVKSALPLIRFEED